MAPDETTARALLAAAADADVADHLGAKAFYRAAEYGREGVAQAFYDAGVLTCPGGRFAR